MSFGADKDEEASAFAAQTREHLAAINATLGDVAKSMADGEADVAAVQNNRCSGCCRRS